MSLQQIAVGIAILAVAAFAWRYRHSELMQGLVNPPTYPPETP